MPSFFTLPIEFLAHEPCFIVAFVTTNRPLLNCSIVPSLLSNKTLWKSISGVHDWKFYHLFSTFSHTTQFSSRMTVPARCNGALFFNLMFYPLLRHQPYFHKTLKHFSSSPLDPTGSVIITMLREVRSLESVTLNQPDAQTIRQLVFLPIRELNIYNSHPAASAEFARALEHDNSTAVIQHTLTEFRCDGLVDHLNFLSLFSHLKVLELWAVGSGQPAPDEDGVLDISTSIGTLKKLETLRLDGYNLVVSVGGKTVENYLSCFIELRLLEITRYPVSTLSFLEPLVHLRHLFVWVDSVLQIRREGTFQKEVNYIACLPELRNVYVEWGDIEEVDSTIVSEIILDAYSSLDLLDELDLKSITLAPDGMVYLHSLASSLRHLTISAWFDDDLSDDDLLKLFSKLNNLESLQLDDIVFPPETKEFQAVPTQSITAKMLPKLKSLSLASSANLSERMFCEFISQLSSLEELNLKDCDLSHILGWMRYVVPLRSLKKIVLDCICFEWEIEEKIMRDAATFIDLELLIFPTGSHVADETLDFISSTFPRLREVRGGVSKLDSICRYLSKLKNLGFLKFEFFKILNQTEYNATSAMFYQVFHKSTRFDLSVESN